MDTYLAIITTVLVATQIIRIVQNTISLRNNTKVIKEELKHLSDVTREDQEMQRKANRCIVEVCEWVMKGRE